MGSKVRLVTTQNTYLSIQGFEAYTGSWSGSSSVRRTRRTRRTSSTYNIRANTKVGFNIGGARQSTNYGNNSYPA